MLLWAKCQPCITGMAWKKISKNMSATSLLNLIMMLCISICLWPGLLEVRLLIQVQYYEYKTTCIYRIITTLIIILVFIYFIWFYQITWCHRCQMFIKIKTQAPELIPIKVNEPLELDGIDLIGKYRPYILVWQ